MIESFTARDAGSYLAGYLHPFALRRPLTVFDPRTGGAWVLPALARWWDRPGVPAVPLTELVRLETGRVNFILHEVFRTARARDELERLTTKTGRPLQELLLRCRAAD